MQKLPEIMAQLCMQLLRQKKKDTTRFCGQMRLNINMCRNVEP